MSFSTGSIAVTRYPHSFKTRETRPSPRPTSRASPAPCPMNASNDVRYAQNSSWFGARAHAVHSDALRDQCLMSSGLPDMAHLRRQLVPRNMADHQLLSKGLNSL